MTLRVALLGPSHFARLDGTAVTGADVWRTPLGDVPIDRDLRSAAVAAGSAVDDRPHEADHALEVELPFLQRCCKRLAVLPVAVADGGAEVVGAVADVAVVVVSTDLSHYHEDAAARTLDRRTARAVANLDVAAIGDRDACGAAALRAVVRHARGARWTCTLLELGTSAAAAGDDRRVVGYGAFAFTE